MTMSTDDKNVLLLRLKQACAIGVIAMLGACSSGRDQAALNMHDPYEETNRSVFAFNMGLDSAVLEPVADGYRSVVPSGGQRAIANHLDWVTLPNTAINSTLQGKFENAGLAVLRFAVNGLTLGLVDLMDEDERPTREDFGQTLAAANIAEGPYVVMPVLGGSTSRELAGRVVDFAINPLSILNTGETTEALRTAQIPMGAVSVRAENFELINQVKYESLDPYARVRAVYYQQREGLLADQNPDDASTAADDVFETIFE
ncbi:MAG: VacJ family lipoprotein [Candidatus Puniceispirillaceae bacterium]